MLGARLPCGGIPAAWSIPEGHAAHYQVRLRMATIDIAIRGHVSSVSSQASTPGSSHIGAKPSSTALKASLGEAFEMEPSGMLGTSHCIQSTA